ncbi:hypothetical protein BZB76_3270 [Actinomadura pelletieri DSM 43383]|uniref:Sporulation and spore germination protein n=1 Tax=Actinomadura pelletieri DSM 43383 TaxID=1120940 RepID=A0A495QP82_9ACTN|nr:hypothetical protein [Actinomadura pelletieri]RKS74751.1 hypothetical protein BZB76_3270 [Actinomadura pelletieri DSM 43383]
MIRVRAARWTALTALAVVLTASGCGIRPTGIVDAGDPPFARGYADTITIYLVRGGMLRPVTRPGVPGRPYLAVEQLHVPTTPRERALGLRTEVRRALTVQAVSDGLGSTSDGHSPLAVQGTGRSLSPAWSRTALAQIACTAEAVPGIEGVILVQATNTGGGGGRLVYCRQFADLLP